MSELKGTPENPGAQAPISEVETAVLPRVPEAPDLLVVWRDNGEALITTRKHPDGIQACGPVCWPKGISGYYLESHCRKAIFHPSALEVLVDALRGGAR